MNIADNIPNNVEHFLNIDGYDNYQVSNFGRIRNSTTGKILKPSFNTHGYLKLKLYKHGKAKNHTVHVLVANEFLDKIDGKRYVDHCDRNPLNNHVDNLRYVTSSENNRNRSMRSDNTSNFKGVSYQTSRKKYMAQITHQGIHHFLGRFNTPEEAARAYDAKAKELDPIHFSLNFN